MYVVVNYRGYYLESFDRKENYLSWTAFKDSAKVYKSRQGCQHMIDNLEKVGKYCYMERI